MKKYIIAVALIIGTGAVINTTLQSCTSLATTDLGLSVIKKLLRNGIDKGMGVYGNKEAFLQNNMVDKALPKQLRDINSMLEKISPSLVAKERDYIAQAASYTVNISKPILDGAVNSLNAQESGNNLLSGLLGGNNNTVSAGGLSQLASEQLVNGLFNIIEDYEHQNSKALLGPLGK